MPDHKTVTSDASQWQLVPKVPTDAMLDAAACASMQHLIDCVRDTEKLNEIGSEENVRKTHASRYHSMLAAAPTPAAQSADHFRQMADMVDHSGESTEKVAAQSAGHEAERCARLAELYRDEHASGRCCEETCNEIAKACREYAAPVNGGEREQAVDAAGRILIDAAARSGDEGAITLALQLAGAAPCDACGFVNYKCRCDRAADAQQVGGDAWPMLSDMHLLAITLAYNEGYSKAYDGREFENPFAQTGSQAAAWELGTRDGKEARKAALTSTAKEQK